MIYYFLLLFFIFDYVRPGTFLPGLDVLRLNSFIPIAVILGTLFGKHPVSNREFTAETNTKLLGGLIVLLAVSSVFAAVTMTAFTVTKNVFMYILIYWSLVRQVGDVRRVKGVFMTIVLIHISLCAMSPEMFTNGDGRTGLNAGGFLGDGNDFSLSVSVALSLCLFLLLESRKVLAKVFWVLVMLVLVLAIVATKSRGGTLAIASVGLYFWIRSERKVLTASLTMLAVVIVLAFAPSAWFERMGTMTDTEEGSAQGRILAWKQSVVMAVHSPLIGVGPGHFPMANGNAQLARWTTAHSIYFLVLGELGFPGLGILLGLIISNLAANHRLLNEVRRLPRDQIETATNLLTCTSGALVAFAVGGAFLSAAYYPHLYVISGLMVAGRRIVRLQLEARERVGQDQQVPGTQLARLPIRPDAISPEWQPRPALTGIRRARTS